MCWRSSLSIKLKVEITFADLKPLVAFPVANPKKNDILEAASLGVWGAAPFGGWGTAQHLQFGQVQVPSALL